MGGVGGDASSSRRGSEKVLKAVRKASYTRRRSYKPAESWTAHYKQVAEEEGRLSGADKMTAAARRLIQANSIYRRFSSMANDRRQTIVQALRASPNFMGISDVQLAVLARAGTERIAPRYTVIFREGAHAKSFYVLLEGRLQQSNIAGDRRAVLSAEDGGTGVCFGTESLTGGLIRHNTVTTLCECEVVHFDTHDILEASYGNAQAHSQAHHRGSFSSGRRGSCSTSGHDGAPAPAPTMQGGRRGPAGGKSATHNEAAGGVAVTSFFVSVLIMNALRNTKLLEGLPERTIQGIASLFSLDDVAKGETIFQQKDASDTMYVLIDGGVKVVMDGVEVIKISVTADQPTGLPVFGESAVVDGQPRIASLVAAEECHLLSLPKKNFRNFLTAVPDFKTRIQQMADLRKKQSALTTTINSEQKAFQGEYEALQVIQQASRSMLTKRRNTTTLMDNAMRHSVVTTYEMESIQKGESDPALGRTASRKQLTRDKSSSSANVGGPASPTAPSTRTSDYH